MSQVDAKVAKLVGEAKNGLRRLEKDIGAATVGAAKGRLDPAKATAAAKKVNAFLSKFTPVAKISSSPLYPELSEETRSGVDWVQEIMGVLLMRMGDLQKAAKGAKLDPQKQRDKWVITVKVASKDAKAEMGGLPPGVGTLVKQIEKGIDVDAPGIGALPLVIMLLLIAHVIKKGWSTMR